MAQANTKAGTSEIMRLKCMVAHLREQIDAVEAAIAAMLPGDEASAIYQRQRSICTDRERTMSYLEGRLR